VILLCFSAGQKKVGKYTPSLKLKSFVVGYDTLVACKRWRMGKIKLSRTF
jgi:hypothetical protein